MNNIKDKILTKKNVYRVVIIFIVAIVANVFMDFIWPLVVETFNYIYSLIIYFFVKDF